MLKFDFCLPTLGKTIPTGDNWFREVKYDGYRLRVERDGDRSAPIAEILALPDVTKRLADLAAVPVGGTPDEAAA
ncbi:hypothetical protein JQ615_40385 [Bradyrhizobium jicamae]|uniref:ATP-dependent DNA ligase family profile domain-containing protein n=1 Tax=Bradyrhizobium jicamae TaxID=280332 RepID=A0ABS5FY10_9BRAD|nr:hypothetical protein [Bradyrhizobium jicamae]MBR0801610.1 hypothetical protein [Bradyrhizobium jicamae]